MSVSLLGYHSLPSELDMVPSSDLTQPSISFVWQPLSKYGIVTLHREYKTHITLSKEKKVSKEDPNDPRLSLVNEIE
jgi:hypothetical protein